MSDSERTSHWQFLAELLGAKPRSEPDTSSAPEQPPTESQPTAEAGEAFAAEVTPPSPPSPVRAKRPPKASPRSATPGRHWGELARSLGIDVPEVPEEEETPLVEEAHVEPAVEPEPEVTARPRRDTIHDERRAEEPARDVEPELPDFTAAPSPRDNFLEEVGLVEDTFETIDEEAAQIARDIEPSSQEESPRSGSRRRRRGRQRRRREGAPEGEPAAREPEVQPASLPDVELTEGDDLREEPPAEARPSGARRRRRRRGGGGERRAAESRSEERAEREPTEKTGRAPSRPSRERPPEKPHVHADDYDEPDDEGDEDFGERRSRRSIPSWSEAVQDIVNLNLSARQKSRRPRGGRGRRPNQRDR